MKEKIKVGIIGAGRIGKVHASNIVYFIPEAKIIEFLKKTKFFKKERIFDTSAQSAEEIVRTILSLI